MNKAWVAAIAAVGGIAAGTLAGCNPNAGSSSAADPVNRNLLDRVAIEDLITRYYENFGRAGASEEFANYYTEDAVFDVNGIVSTGRKEIAAVYAGLARSGDAPATRGAFHMIISNPVIDVNGDTATAKVLWTGVLNTEVGARPTLWEQGREYDLLVRQNGKWLIRKRVVVADSGLPESMKATYTPRTDYDITAGK